MIDISRSEFETKFPPIRPSGKKWLKLLLIAVLIVLLGGSAWAVYFFVANSNTARLKQGEDFEYQNYVFSVDKVFLSTCPELAYFDCKNWQEEPGVQYHFKNKTDGGVTYGYLGLQTGPKMAEQGLSLELMEVNLDSKEIKIKLETK